jgi:hypothetical protein
LPDAPQIATPQKPPARNATLSMPEPIHPDVQGAVSPIETVDECQASDVCIDQYLWSLYQRASKLDTVKVEEQKKVTVEKNGKLRTVIKKKSQSSSRRTSAGRIRRLQKKPACH